MSEQALSDVKVLDLTWYIAGPYCTKLLADYGADVIKVERPGEGDPARRMSPFFKDDPHPEKSGLFLHLNTNKRGITLNLKTETGKKMFKELVKDVDVLVESFSPQVMPSLGLGYEELEKINPKLVMTSISNFGQTGPYRDFKATDMIIYGMGGAMYFTGIPEREPVRLGGTVVSYQVGAIAAVATMFALYAAGKRGYGEHLDVSAYEATRGSIDRATQDLTAYQYCGNYDVRTAAVARRYPAGIYACKDGYFDIVGGYVTNFPRSARMMGRPELATDPRYCTTEAQLDVHRKEEFETQFFYPWIVERTKSEVWAAAQEAHLPSAPICNARDVLEDPHYRLRDYWKEIEHPVTGRLTYPGAPFRSSDMPSLVRSPAPLIGEHNDEVYSALGYTREDLLKLREQGVI